MTPGDRVITILHSFQGSFFSPLIFLLISTAFLAGPKDAAGRGGSGTNCSLRPLHTPIVQISHPRHREMGDRCSKSNATKCCSGFVKFLWLSYVGFYPIFSIIITVFVLYPGFHRALVQADTTLYIIPVFYFMLEI